MFAAASIEQTLGGASGVVDVWCFFYEDVVADPKVRAAYLALLSVDERARLDRFLFVRDQRRYLATRALVRTVLATYTSAVPASFRFGTGEYGKPYVTRPSVGRRLHFNLSNTQGLVACAVSMEHELVGVDVESCERTVDTESVAGSHFSPSEASALRALPESERLRDFLRIWTLKESYIKATGLGLTLPLDRFSFHIDGGGISITFEATLRDDSTLWRFALFDVSPAHVLALGVNTGGARLHPRLTTFVPLHGIVRS